MGNSLQDQLLKTGLADEKRAREIEQEKKSKGKRKQPKSKRGAEQRQKAEQARQQQAQKAERDRALEAERQKQRRAKETATQIRQIAKDNRVDRAKGEAVYRFTDGSRIKEIQVTDDQRQRLARGELAVVAVSNKAFEVVPAGVAERIRGIDENAVKVVNQPQADEADPDDPYADYPVPDDLMW